MRLAIITPWPGDKSGIADYSYDLVKGLLASNQSITVFTRCDNPIRVDGIRIVNSEPEEWELAEFELRIFHFGNNLTFHSHMLDLLQKFGGVVHLHDFVLHHLMAGLAQTKNGWEWYFEKVAHLYSESFAEQAKVSLAKGKYIWENEEVSDFPFNEEVVKAAQAVITHSNFSKIQLCDIPAACIYQVYDMPEVQRIKHDKFIFGVFGHVQPNKCIHQLIDALGALDPRGKEFEIRVAGKIADESYYRELHDKLSHIDNSIELKILGYVPDNDFLTEINSADIVIALRNPTMGETSAIVMRALQLHKPVIVTDIGWYSELPDFIYKIKPGSPGTVELAAIINEIIGDSGALEAISSEVAAFAEQNLSFSKTCRHYLDILHTIQSHQSGDTENIDVYEIIAKRLYDLQLTEPKHKELRHFIYRKVKPLI